MSRGIPIIRAECSPGVINTPKWRNELFKVINSAHIETQALFSCFVDHPHKRNKGQTIVRIATSKIGVHAGKPNLRQGFFVRVIFFRKSNLVRLKPQNWMERCALVID